MTTYETYQLPSYQDEPVQAGFNCYILYEIGNIFLFKYLLDTNVMVFVGLTQEKPTMKEKLKSTKRSHHVDITLTLNNK